MIAHRILIDRSQSDGTYEIHNLSNTNSDPYQGSDSLLNSTTRHETCGTSPKNIHHSLSMQCAFSISAHAGDKLLHLMAYSLMTFLSFQSITGSRIARILVSLLLIAGLGLIDEGIQYFLPYRNASLADWCFDIAAAVVVIFFLGLRHSES